MSDLVTTLPLWRSRSLTGKPRQYVLRTLLWRAFDHLTNPAMHEFLLAAAAEVDGSNLPQMRFLFDMFAREAHWISRNEGAYR